MQKMVKRYKKNEICLFVSFIEEYKMTKQNNPKIKHKGNYMILNK